MARKSAHPGRSAEIVPCSKAEVKGSAFPPLAMGAGSEMIEH